MAVSQIDEATASQLFSTEFQDAYQSKQKLGMTIMERHGTSGTTLNIPVIDKIEMQPWTFAPTNIPVTQVQTRNVQCDQYEFVCKTTVGRGQKTLFAYDLIRAHAEMHSLAAARWLDTLKIQAIFNNPLYAPSSFHSIPLGGVGVNTGINEGKLAEGLAYLESQGVDVTGNTSCWLPAVLQPSLFDDEKVVNYFYNDTKPLANNSFSHYLGVDFRKLAAQGAGSNFIPFTVNTGGNDQFLVPMVQKESMIISFNMDPVTQIVYVPQEMRWEVVSMIVAGAQIVQQNGVVLINAETPYTENTAEMIAAARKVRNEKLRLERAANMQVAVKPKQAGGK